MMRRRCADKPSLFYEWAFLPASRFDLPADDRLSGPETGDIVQRWRGAFGWYNVGRAGVAQW